LKIKFVDGLVGYHNFGEFKLKDYNTLPFFVNNKTDTQAFKNSIVGSCVRSLIQT